MLLYKQHIKIKSVTRFWRLYSYITFYQLWGGRTDPGFFIRILGCRDFNLFKFGTSGFYIFKPEISGSGTLPLKYVCCFVHTLLSIKWNLMRLFILVGSKSIYNTWFNSPCSTWKKCLHRIRNVTVVIHLFDVFDMCIFFLDFVLILTRSMPLLEECFGRAYHKPSCKNFCVDMKYHWYVHNYKLPVYKSLICS